MMHRQGQVPTPERALWKLGATMFQWLTSVLRAWRTNRKSRAVQRAGMTKPAPAILMRCLTAPRQRGHGLSVWDA
jgi:hypothetical protein